MLTPDREVIDALDRVSPRVRSAAVTNNISSRLDACLRASELDGFFPSAHRFSAGDKMPRQISMPDSAIYRWAATELGATGVNALAIEGSASGVRAAPGAGLTTIGTVAFVPDAERAERRRQLRAVGAAAVASSWRAIADLAVGNAAPPVFGRSGTRGSPG